MTARQENRKKEGVKEGFWVKIDFWGRELREKGMRVVE